MIDQGTYTSFTQTLAINLTQPFAAWASTYGMNGALAGAPTHDGVPNLLKYLCDIHPSSPMGAADRAALPSLGMDTTTNPGTEYITLAYRQNVAVSGVTVSLQTSSDLQNWTTVTSPDLDQQMGTDSTTGDPIREVGVKATGAQQFLRLNVISQ